MLKKNNKNNNKINKMQKIIKNLDYKQDPNLRKKFKKIA